MQDGEAADASPRSGRGLAAGTRSSRVRPDRATGGGPGRDALGEVADRLHRLSGVPFRLELSPDGPDAAVPHDSLDPGWGGEAEVVPLEDGGGGGARLVVRATDAGDGTLEMVRGVLARQLRLETENRLFVRELSERYEEISLLTSISETLGSVIELDRAAEIILQEVVEVTGAARASLWLLEDHGEALELLASRGMEDPAVRRVGVGEPDSLVATVFERQAPLLVEPDGRDLPEELRAAWRGFRGAPLLAVPVTYTPPEGERRRVGVLALVGRRDGSRFTAGDRKLMTVVASQVGAAVETGRLVRESLRRERLATELGLAHDLQLKLLPSPRTVADLVDVAARSEPAESVGGDFYHLLRLPGGRVGVMLGDVSSHGISASLIMAQAMSAAGIVAREEERPADVVRRVEEELRRELESTEMYVALFYAVVDPEARSLRYASAGHPHAFLLGGGRPRRLEALDVPVGLRAGGEYHEVAVEAGDDSILLLFTDGLFEPAPGAWEEAEGRVVAAASAAASGGPEATVEAVFEAARGGKPVEWDDRTAVAVRI
jgi:hypothetical protein